MAGDFPASAACRLARHDDVQGERDASSSGILASSRIRSSVTLHSEGSGSSFLQEGLLESRQRASAPELISKDDQNASDEL